MNYIRLYFKTFCYYFPLIIIAAFTFAVSFGCYPGIIIPSKVMVFSKKPLDSKYRSKKLAIVPFNTSVMKPDFGITVGKIFEKEIAKRHFFESIVLIEETPWDKQITITEQKIRAAVFEARERNADLLLWGEIEEFQIGTLSRPEITITVKLIDVSTSSLLWWGSGKTSGIPGNRFLFWAQIPPEEAPPASKLIKQVAQKLTVSMFSETNQFFGKAILARCQAGFRRLVRAAGTEQNGKEPTSSETSPERIPEKEFPEHGDIIDDALDELESIVVE